MAIVKMKKLSLISLKKDSDLLLRRLMQLSCVEIEARDMEEGNVPQDISAERNAVYSLYKKTESAIKFLTPYDESRRSLFAKRPVMTAERLKREGEAYNAAVSDVEAAEKLRQRREELLVSRNALADKKTRLQPWSGYDLPLEFRGTESSELTLGVLPEGYDLSGLTEKYPELETETVSNDGSFAYYCFIYPSSSEEIKDALSAAGISTPDFKGMKDLPAKELQNAERRITAADEELARIDSDAVTAAEKLPELKQLSDILGTELLLLGEKQKFSSTGETVYMTAWAPESRQKRLCGIFDCFDCCYEFSDPDEGDDVPVVLDNRQPAKAFEPIVELFSLPAYDGFDPTFFVSLFYFVIFGFMLADAVYGALLAVGGFLAYKLLDLPRGTKRLVLMFAICGISCMAAGILLGSYLGDLPQVLSAHLGSPDKAIPSLVIWFDPVNDPITFLILSLALGAVHLLVGMGIRFYMLCRRGKVFDAVFDIGSWFVLFAGIGVFFLNKNVGLALVALGALMLIFTQGRAEKNIIMKFFKGVYSLYDIINYVSDLLSYSRIMALGVASAVIASVVNLLSTMIPKGILGFFLTLVILLAGHLLNLAINLLGSFVHTSRLQYIEFFGKFYEDGGRTFKPIAPELNYTVFEEEIKNK